MKIKNVKLSNYLKEEIKKAVKILLKNNKKSKNLDNIFGKFTVSIEAPANNLFFYSYTGEELELPEVKNIYILKDNKN